MTRPHVASEMKNAVTLTHSEVWRKPDVLRDNGPDEATSLITMAPPRGPDATPSDAKRLTDGQPWPTRAQRSRALQAIGTQIY